MSYELLAFDLDLLLERLQDGTDFPYGDGDERLINNINQTARALRLPEPIEAKISESSVYFKVRRWGTGEKAASLYQAQLIAMIIDGQAVYDHHNALRGPHACVLNPLRDWLNEAKRQRLVRTIEEEAPRYSKSGDGLTAIEEHIWDVLREHAERNGPHVGMPGKEVLHAINKKYQGKLDEATLSKKVRSLTAKGCPCRSDGPHTGYRLIPDGPLAQQMVESARAGKKLARSGS